MARNNNSSRSFHGPRRVAGQGARGRAAAAEIRYKIYTARSWRNSRLIKRRVRELKLGVTLFRSEGGWVESAEKYVNERSMLIEIIAPAKDRANIRSKIQKLCKFITAADGLGEKEVWVYEDQLPTKWVIKQRTRIAANGTGGNTQDIAASLALKIAAYFRILTRLVFD